MELNSYRQVYAGKKDFWIFLASDIHLDSPSFDKKRFSAEFDEAKNLGARIYLNGDVFDSILPGDRKRFTRAGSKHESDAIINEIVAEAVELFTPYADNIDLIGVGNHDTAPIKFNHIDPVAWLIRDLNRVRSEKARKEYGVIVHGGYTGFIRNTFAEKDGGHTQTWDIFYNHGQGGSSEVTKGAIDLNRRSYISADLIWLGHKHTKISEMMDPQLGVDSRGALYLREKRGVITGCYSKPLSQYDINKGGYRLNFGEERMRVPQAQGGALLRLEVSREGVRGRVMI